MRSADEGLTGRQTARYAITAVGLSWLIQVPPILAFGIDSGTTRLAFVLTMWSPPSWRWR